MIIAKKICGGALSGFDLQFGARVVKIERSRRTLTIFGVA